MATWVLTGSPENYAATAARGHALIGMKERRRLMAEHMEPGELFEDRTPVWPGKPGVR